MRRWRRDQIGMRCKARRRRAIHISPGAATPQRARSAAACGCGRALARERTQRLCRCVGDPALRVEARTGVCRVAALAKGYPIEGAIQWAPITPTNVVQHVGAQEGLLDEETLKEWLSRAPEWYKAERI